MYVYGNLRISKKLIFKKLFQDIQMVSLTIEFKRFLNVQKLPIFQIIKIFEKSKLPFAL